MSVSTNSPEEMPELLVRLTQIHENGALLPHTILKFNEAASLVTLATIRNNAHAKLDPKPKSRFCLDDGTMIDEEEGYSLQDYDSLLDLPQGQNNRFRVYFSTCDIGRLWLGANVSAKKMVQTWPPGRVLFLDDSTSAKLFDAGNAMNQVRGLPVGPIIHPDNMSFEMWEGVCKWSSILKGWSAQKEDGFGGKTRITVSRAPKPAFEIKKLHWELHDDDSYIHVREVKRGIESALTMNNFTEKGVQAALSGGAYSLTAGVVVDATWSKEKEDSRSQGWAQDKLHCSFNFPRVRVDLKQSTLKWSTELRDFAVSTPENYQEFFNQFGGVFCSKVILGGRFFSVENMVKNDKTITRKQKDEMKIAMSTNFMSPYGGGAVGGHRNKATATSASKKEEYESREVSVQCQGGNPLVSWSPPDWAVSVASYYYWRAIEQEEVVEWSEMAKLKTVEGDDKVKNFLSGYEQWAKSRLKSEKEPKDSSVVENQRASGFHVHRVPPKIETYG